MGPFAARSLNFVDVQSVGRVSEAKVCFQFVQKTVRFPHVRTINEYINKFLGVKKVLKSLTLCVMVTIKFSKL